MKLGVTGSRPQDIGHGWNDKKLHNAVKKHMLKRLLHWNPEIILTGMALGVDQWAAEAAISLGIPFIAALPFKQQDTSWTPKVRQHYQWILSKALKIVQVDRMPGYISSHALPGVYHNSKMIVRNHWVVDQLTGSEDVLLAIYNGDPSLTCMSEVYADSKVSVDTMRIDLLPEYSLDAEELPF